MFKSVLFLIIALCNVLSIEVFASSTDSLVSGKDYLFLVTKLQSARDIIYTDPLVASKILEECIELSLSSNEDSLYYVARELYVSSFGLRNRLDSAILLSNELLSDLPKDRYFVIQAMLYNNIGTLYGKNNDFNTAIGYHKELTH